MIKPLNNNVLIKQCVEKTVSGIYIPNTNNNLYEVIAIGKSVMEVKVGTNVIIDLNHIKELKYQGSNYYLVSEDKILGVVED